MTDKIKTTFASSALEVLANGLTVDDGGPYGGKTRVMFNWPDADHHEYDENTGEVIIIDTCSDGAPHFLGTYPQAEGIAQLIAELPAMLSIVTRSADTHNARGLATIAGDAAALLERLGPALTSEPAQGCPHTTLSDFECDECGEHFPDLERAYHEKNSPE